MFYRLMTEEGESFCNGAIHVLIRPTQVGRRTFRKVVVATTDCLHEQCGEPIDFDGLPDVVEEALGLRMMIPTHMLLLEGGVDSESDRATTITEGGSMVTPHRFARGQKIHPGSSESIVGQTRLIDGGWARTRRIIRNIDGKAHIEECIDDEFSLSDSAWQLFEANGFSRIEAYQIIKALQDDDLIAPCFDWIRRVTQTLVPHCLRVMLDGLQYENPSDCRWFLEDMHLEIPFEDDLGKMKSLLSGARLVLHCHFPVEADRDGSSMISKKGSYSRA